MPIVTFFLLTRYGVPTVLALVAGGLFPAINAGRSWVTSHKLQPLGIIVMSFIVLGTAVSLISYSVFFTQAKESFLTASFGFLCLGSLIGAKRPLLFYVVRQFLAGNDPVKLKWYDDSWQRPGARVAFRFVTLVWGIAYLHQKDPRSRKDHRRLLETRVLRLEGVHGRTCSVPTNPVC